jgi:hypothetical protein
LLLAIDCAVVEFAALRGHWATRCSSYRHPKQVSNVVLLVLLGSLVVVVVVVVVVVLVDGYGLRSVGSGCPILHGQLIPCGCGVVGADSLCPFLLVSTLYQEPTLGYPLIVSPYQTSTQVLSHPVLRTKPDIHHM